jgi:hypothetical protein
VTEAPSVADCRRIERPAERTSVVVIPIE